MAGLKGNQKRATNGKFAPNPVARPGVRLESLHSRTSGGVTVQDWATLLIPGGATAAPTLNLSRYSLNTSYPYPQANSIDKLASGIDAINEGANTDEAVAMALGVTDRQGAYYATSLAYLGMVQEDGDSPRSWGLTSSGAAFLNAGPIERAAILEHLYEQMPEPSEVLSDDGEPLSDATVARRMAAVESWGSALADDDAVGRLELERDSARERAPEAAAHAAEQRRQAREAKPVVRHGQVCSVHFIVMSVSGVCPDC